LCLQRIACQDRGRLSEHYVTSGTPAPQVVIVERGQIIVDERVGVQHFEGGAHVVNAIGQAAFNHAAGFATEDGAQALASGKHAVAHRLVDRSRVLRLGGKQTLQRPIGRNPTFFQCVSQHGK